MQSLKYSALLCFAICLLLSPGARAQTQHEMNNEAARSYEAADAELNRVYGELKALLSPGDRKKLVAAELAWIKYRDADSEFIAFENSGGSIYPLVYYGAMTARTLTRTAELQELLDDRGSR